MPAENAASSSGSHVWPRAASWSRLTVESTDAACGPPMTEIRLAGQDHRKRGEWARPHCEELPSPNDPPTLSVIWWTRCVLTEVSLLRQVHTASSALP